jgi:phospholipid/cholesterol/gamma-HCH transport system substrate-binding protein
MIRISKEIKVGLFAFTGIAVLVLGYDFLKGRDLFNGNTKYYVVYQNVDGIVKSTQITINGFTVGQVEQISMLRKGDASNILVSMLVNSDIQIPRGTKATIIGTDLLGTKAIALTLSRSADILHPGDTLVSGMEASLQSTIQNMVSPLKEKSEEVLVTLDRVLKTMNDIFDSSGTQKLASGINDFSTTLHHIRNISQRFDDLTVTETEKLKVMLAHVESITLNLRNSNEAISSSLKNISRITDSVAASNLTATINNTNRVMGEFAITLDKINKGEGSLGKLANDKTLYDNLSKSSSELTSLLKDMQEYPGRYFSVSVFGSSRATSQDKKREQNKKNGK